MEYRQRKEYKMNILYISISFPRESEGNNLYTDLAEMLARKHKLTVVVAEQKVNTDKTYINEERNFEVLRVKTGNIFNVSLIEKAISYITMQRKLKKAIKKYLNKRKYDMILFMAPPVTMGSIVKYAMKKYNAISYLMQKDIFPQNSLDLGLMNKKHPAYYYFKYKEKYMYKIATKIGCMSQGNIEYLLKNNKSLSKEKLEIFPNTITLRNFNNNKNNIIRQKYNISEEKVLALYGGNFGKPQGIDFVIRVLEEYKKDERVVFFFSGKGTEKEKLYKYIKEKDIRNVIMTDYLPKQEYNYILKEADIGLIFLDYRFTIPNIPSRTLSYFEYSIPIMSATDKNTDYKEILVNQAKAGLWCESNNIEEFKKQFDYLITHKEERAKMGQNGRKYLEEKLTTKTSMEILEKTLEEFKGGNRKCLKEKPY